MKKIIAIFLLMVFVFSSVACGPKKGDDKSGKDKASPITQRNKDLEKAEGE